MVVLFEQMSFSEGYFLTGPGYHGPCISQIEITSASAGTKKNLDLCADFTIRRGSYFFSYDNCKSFKRIILTEETDTVRDILIAEGLVDAESLKSTERTILRFWANPDEEMTAQQALDLHPKRYLNSQILIELD